MFAVSYLKLSVSNKLQINQVEYPTHTMCVLLPFIYVKITDLGCLQHLTKNSKQLIYICIFIFGHLDEVMNIAVTCCSVLSLFPYLACHVPFVQLALYPFLFQLCYTRSAWARLVVLLGTEQSVYGDAADLVCYF